jgi:dienelactone hydrolase
MSMSRNQPIQQRQTANWRRGEPTGTTFKLADNIETYVAEPKGKQKDAAILFIADVLGIWQNSKLMADQFAANGYYTLLPDLFNGDPVPSSGSLAVPLMEWLNNGSDGKNPHTYTFVDPIVEKALKYLKEEKGFKKIGAVGYCFVSLHSSLRAVKLTLFRAASMWLAS